MSEFLTAEEEQTLFKIVTDMMIQAVRPSATALVSENDDVVRLEGSGTFISVADRLIVLTCAHVTNCGGTDYGFYGSTRMFSGKGSVIQSSRIDVALIEVPFEVWRDNAADTVAIPMESLADSHDRVDNELFFMTGFAGENSRFAFESIEGTATGYCTQINRDAPAERHFFSLYWKPGFIQPTPGTDLGVAKYTKAEDPRGFSGACVWDTGFIRAYQAGRPWAPTDARVAGLVTSWDMTTESLVARRIEDVRAWILESL